tara:strand:- start:9938 stop:12574 length:2637 start_codon:yes stop_codon:yes gene_type:complete
MATIELRDLNPAEFNNNLIVYGKVGIGSSDLAYNGLQIKPSSGNGQLVVERASGASYLINAQASLVQIGTISNSPLQLITNSNAFVHLTTGGRLGVGTTSPTNLLHLEETTTANAYVHVQNTTIGNAGIKLQNSQGQWTIVANDRLRFIDDDSGVERMSITSAGNVGINETAPSKRLNVNSGSTGTVAEFESTSTTAKIQFNNSGGNACFIGSNNDKLLFQTNSTNRIAITNAGDIGCGTTTPDARIEIVSDGSDDAGAHLRLTHANNNSTDVVSTVNFSNNSGSVAKIVAGTTGANNTGYISFFTDNAGTSSEKMRILADGKIGIGTSAAAANLHVEGGSSQARLIVNSNTQQDNHVAIGYGSVGAEIDNGTFLTHVGSGNTFNIDNGGAPNSIVAIKTRPSSGSSVERLRVDKDGNVGINETTPTEKLHVDGNLKVTGNVIVGSSGATTLSDTGPYDPYVLFKWEGQYHQNGGHNDPPNQFFDTQLHYADATSPWNKSSVATKSCEDLTTLVGTATFDTTYKKSRSWNWHYLMGLKNTDRTNTSFPTNYMRIKMPVYYTAGASDHHVFYLKILMDRNSGYQLCVANEAGTPQKRAGVATRTSGGVNTRGVGVGPRNCNAMQGHRYYGEWTNVLIAKEHIEDYSFADTGSPTGRSINLTINMTGTQNSDLYFMGIAIGKNKKGVVVNGPRGLYHGMAEGNSNRGQWPDGGGTFRDGLRHNGNWHYSEMVYVYHRYACFTPIQIPSTDKDLIVTILDSGYHDHHEDNTHFFLVDDDGLGVKDGNLADDSQAGRYGYNSIAPNTVYKGSVMNIGSCQNMMRNIDGHYGRTAMTFIIPQSEVARVASTTDGIKHLKLGMSQVHNHWNHGYMRAIYVEEAS